MAEQFSKAIESNKEINEIKPNEDPKSKILGLQQKTGEAVDDFIGSLNVVDTS